MDRRRIEERTAAPLHCAIELRRASFKTRRSHCGAIDTFPTYIYSVLPFCDSGQGIVRLPAEQYNNFTIHDDDEAPTQIHCHAEYF